MIGGPTNKAPKSISRDFMDKDGCEPTRNQYLGAMLDDTDKTSKNMHKQDKQTCKATTIT